MPLACAKALAWPWCPRSRPLKDNKKKAVVAAPSKVLPSNSSSYIRKPAFTATHLPLDGKEWSDMSDMQGSHIWHPAAPLVARPRAHYNAASLAYLGDCIYELYVRCHFLSPPQAIDKYNNLVMGLVCCEAQDVFLKELLKDDFLSEEERDIVRWGKNVQTSHKRATKRAGAAVYSRASSLETLIGYLYLTKPGRLQEVMNRLGLNWRQHETPGEASEFEK